MASRTGPSRSTQHDGTVILEVNPKGPYGVHLESDRDGNCAVIKSWERLPGGKFGPIQKHGGIRIFDYLVQINDMDCTTTRFGDVVSLLQDSNQLRKTLIFASPAKYRQIMAERAASGSSRSKLNADDGPDFVSSIRQGRVNTDNERDPFAEYEVVCRLRLVTNKVTKGTTLKWSIWHRFSEFETLDTALRKNLGWQMQSIEFPPKHSFTFNKLSVDFIDKRREDLDEYWLKLMELERITDFHKHHCSEELRDFLDVVHKINTGRAQSSAEATPAQSEEDVFDGDAASGDRERRGSTKKASGGRKKQTLASRRRASVKNTGGKAGGQQYAALEAGPSPSSPADPAPPNPSGGAGPAPAAPEPAPAAPQMPSDPRYAKYQKMLNMHIPRMAIEVKMQAEGLDPSLLLDADDTFAPPAAAAPAAAAAPPPPPAARAPPAAPAPRATAPPARSAPPPSSAGRGGLLSQINAMRKE